MSKVTSFHRISRSKVTFFRRMSRSKVTSCIEYIRLKGHIHTRLGSDKNHFHFEICKTKDWSKHARIFHIVCRLCYA